MTTPTMAADLRGEAAPLLKRVRAEAFPVLREEIARISAQDERLGWIAGYHLGWNEADGSPGNGDHGGRTVTLVLTALAAEAAGAPADEALAAAVAMELAKDFIQLQDDVIDNDPIRRERASAWQAFGVGAALLGADALRHQAMDVLARHRPHGLAAAWHLQETLGRVVAGQARDLSFEQRPWSGAGKVTLAEYRAMATMKTSPLFECVLSLGAVLHGAPSTLVADLIEAGRNFGLACQALDDILDLWGSPDPRDNFNDLRQGKKTLPILAALATDTTAARQLERLLERLPDEPQLELFQEAADLAEAAGGRFITEQQARGHYQAAVAGLSALPLPQRRRTELITVSSLFGLRGHNETIMVGSV